MKRLLLFPLAATLIIASCKKNNHSNFTDGLFLDDGMIKLNQPAIFVDSTWLYDSVREVFPPHSRQYQWIISPNDPQSVFGENYQYGNGAVIFNRAGTYQLYANIYDSVGNTLIGHTTTATIQVSNDTFDGPLP